MENIFKKLKDVNVIHDDNPEIGNVVGGVHGNNQAAPVELSDNLLQIVLAQGVAASCW